MLFASKSLYAQQKIDNEKEQFTAQLATYSETDINRLPLLTKLVKKTWRVAPHEAEKFGAEALALHDIHDSPLEEALICVYLTRIYIDRRNMKKAQEITSRGIAASKHVDDIKASTFNLFNQALIYSNQDQLVLALDTYRLLEKIYIKNEQTNYLGNVYNNIGNILKKTGDLEGAFDYYQKAIPLIKDLNNKTNYSNTLMSIGEVFSRLGDHKQADHNIKLGLSLISEENSPLSFLEGKIRLGNLYRTSKQYEISLAYFIEAENIAKKYQFTGTLLGIYYEKIKIASETQNIPLLTESLKLAEQLVTSDLTHQLSVEIHYYRALAEVANENWAKADQHINQLLSYDSYSSRYFEMEDVLNLALIVNIQLGDPNKAIAILTESLTRYKNHHTKNRDAFIAQYAQLYKTSEKEQEITLLKRQSAEQENIALQEQQRNRFILFIFVTVSLLLTFLVILFIQRSRSLKRENSLNLSLMQKKKQFFADISHELRTPLTLFKLKIEELEHDIADDPKEVYQLLSERINNFNSLINDISLLAMSDKGELDLNIKEVALLPFFRESANELCLLAKQYQLEANVNIALTENLFTSFDPDRIHQVLINLFSNSCRYTTAPGKINFEVFQEGSTLTVLIEDSAPSLSTEQCHKIFDRLYRADKSRSRKHGGSGLGLSICQNLIDASQGNISATPSPLGGIKIIIAIPIK